MSEHRAERDEFDKAFGRALSEWSHVEEGLVEWFWACTKLDLGIATAVYYSANSFIARRDMLIAAIPFSPFDEKTRQGIRLCAKRARAYSEFRNRIAHGHPIFVTSTNEYAFAQGRHPVSTPRKPHVMLSNLKIAAENFRSLGGLLLGFHPDWQHSSVCEAGCLEEIEALPTVATSWNHPGSRHE